MYTERFDWVHWYCINRNKYSIGTVVFQSIETNGYQDHSQRDFNLKVQGTIQSTIVFFCDVYTNWWPPKCSADFFLILILREKKNPILLILIFIYRLKIFCHANMKGHMQHIQNITIEWGLGWCPVVRKLFCL